MKHPHRRNTAWMGAAASVGTLAALFLAACGDADTESEKAAVKPAVSTGAGEAVATISEVDDSQGQVAERVDAGTPQPLPGARVEGGLRDPETPPPVEDVLETRPEPAPPAGDGENRPADVRSATPSPMPELPSPEEEIAPPPSREPLQAARLAEEKSEEAGKAYLAFIEANTPAEILATIRNPKALEAKVESYHDSHPNGKFEVLRTQIMGAGRVLDDPTKFVFPYFVATDANPYGFLVLVYETDSGFKVSWEQFVHGQDFPLHDFVVSQEPGDREFLVAVKQAHSFDPSLTEEDKAQLLAVKLDMPEVGLSDQPIAYVERDSDVGRELAKAIPWGKIHLCRIGLSLDKSSRLLKIKSYAKLAHPS